MQTNPTTAAALDTFTAHYIAAALQLCDEEIGTDATTESLAPAALAKMQGDCIHFMGLTAQYVRPDKNGSTVEEAAGQAGTDFWLSRNGHGSGFWDRPEIYGEDNAEQLQYLSDTYGPADLYLGDDGQVYHSPA